MEKEVVPYQHIAMKAGAKYGVDWRLIAGIINAESSFNPNAVNPRDNESVGLMQILCRPDGKGGCANKLNISGWSGIRRNALLNPEVNIEMGAQILAWNISNYGVARGIAIYNAWDQRTMPPNGPFKNQPYVDKVLNFARQLGYPN